MMKCFVGLIDFAPTEVFQFLEKNSLFYEQVG